MKRYAVLALVAFAVAGLPCQAQFLKKLEQGLLNGQGQQQGLMPGQQANSLVGDVNLPPGQYMMTNVQTGQAFYVLVQNGQMFLGQQPPSQMMAPGFGGIQQQAPNMLAPGQGMPPQQQQGGMGGLMNGGLGNFLKRELAPQQQQQVPNQ